MQRMSIMNRVLNRLIVSGVLGALLLAIFAFASPAALAKTNGEGSAQASANLRHTPYGTATLKWDPQNEKLWVTIKLTGLAPDSTHPAHIHAGDCDDNGPIVYMLNNVVADNGGNADVTTVISAVEKGIPASGWYINVHNGPGLSPADQFIPIACGNVSNSNTSLQQVQNVQVSLGATDAPNQAAWGNAQLTLKDGTLTVVVTVHGLVPGSVHAEHIHAGSCQNQIPGTVVYMLKNLVGDSNGNATATTVIHDVKSIPEDAWYVNVHRTTDLTTQTGFDPIACGNVEN
jgi:hypothetical protein